MQTIETEIITYSKLGDNEISLVLNTAYPNLREISFPSKEKLLKKLKIKNIENLVGTRIRLNIKLQASIEPI